MIFEGSCDTEDWSNDAEISALHHTIKLDLKKNTKIKLKLDVCCVLMLYT